MSQVTTPLYTAKKISPMLVAVDMKETLVFYQDVLGFSIMLNTAEYCIVERNGLTIHFMKAASQHVLDCVRGHTEIYIEVSRIRELWEHVKSYTARIESANYSIVNTG